MQRNINNVKKILCRCVVLTSASFPTAAVFSAGVTMETISFLFFSLNYYSYCSLIIVRITNDLNIPTMELWDSSNFWLCIRFVFLGCYKLLKKFIK